MNGREIIWVSCGDMHPTSRLHASQLRAVGMEVSLMFRKRSPGATVVHNNTRSACAQICTPGGSVAPGKAPKTTAHRTFGPLAANRQPNLLHSRGTPIVMLRLPSDLYLCAAAGMGAQAAAAAAATSRGRRRSASGSLVRGQLPGEPAIPCVQVFFFKVKKDADTVP